MLVVELTGAAPVRIEAGLLAVGVFEEELAGGPGEFVEAVPVYLHEEEHVQFRRNANH